MRAPQAVEVFVTVGDDGKAVLSSRPPIVRRVAGTRRRALYPVPGELIWVPHQCPEGIGRVLGRVPAPCEPLPCTLRLETRKG